MLRCPGQAWHTMGTQKISEERREGRERERERTEPYRITAPQSHSFTTTDSRTQSIRVSHNRIQGITNTWSLTLKDNHIQHNTSHHHSPGHPHEPYSHTHDHHIRLPHAMSQSDTSHTHNVMMTNTSHAHSLWFLSAKTNTSWVEDQTLSVTLSP